jgi:hypothetical protein
LDTLVDVSSGPVETVAPAAGSWACRTTTVRTVSRGLVVNKTLWHAEGVGGCVVISEKFGLRVDLVGELRGN